jgi:hypothetical protein
MKMQGLNNNLIYRPYCKKKDTKPSKISRSKLSAQYGRTTNEKYDGKEETPENSTKERFPSTLQALNNHDRDPRRLKNHQNSPNKHQNQQSSKK